MTALAKLPKVGRVIPNAPWPVVRLGDIAEFIMGQAPPGEASNFEGRGTIFVKAGEFGPLHPVVKEWTTKPLRYAKSGDVLICVVGATAGKLNIGIDCAIGRSVAAIRPNRQTFDRFVYLQLLPKVLMLRAGSTGSAQGVINRDMLANIEMVLPPIEDQRQIVAEIEKQFTRLDAGIAALRRTQANLKRYRAAVLKAACEGRLVPTEAELVSSQHQRKKRNAAFETGEHLLSRLFSERQQAWQGKGPYRTPAPVDATNLPPLPEGWGWGMSDALFSFITSGSRGWAEYYSETGPLFLRIGNLDHENIRLDLGEVQHVAPPSGAEGMRTVVQPNDILISITADVGMVGLVPEGLGEAYINQHVALARPLPSICPNYVAYYLCASEGGWGRLKKLQRGATKVGLGLDHIRAVPVPLPPLAEQTRIVAEVERRLSVVEELETAVNTNLQRATRLRQSILQRAFNGHLMTAHGTS